MQRLLSTVSLFIVCFHFSAHGRDELKLKPIDAIGISSTSLENRRNSIHMPVAAMTEDRTLSASGLIQFDLSQLTADKVNEEGFIAKLRMQAAFLRKDRPIEVGVYSAKTPYKNPSYIYSDAEEYRKWMDGDWSESDLGRLFSKHTIEKKGKVYEWDVTEWVQKTVTGETPNNGLMVAAVDSKGAAVSSVTSHYQANFNNISVVTYVDIPEPRNIALLTALASMMIVARRRRAVL